MPKINCVNKRKLKVYVIGSLKRKDLGAEVIEAVRKAGHTITFDWVDENDEEQGASFDKLARLTNKPITGAMEADICVLIMAEGMGGKGSFVDLGSALSHNKPVIVLEYDAILNHFFVNNPLVMRVRSIDGTIMWLNLYAQALHAKRIPEHAQ